MHEPIDGIDPLDEQFAKGVPVKSVLQDATKRDVLNILRSYTGYFDVFSEAIQNGLDAIEEKQKLEGPSYTPRIYIEIDISTQRIRVVDNGVGMDRDQFLYCFRPSVSFKSRRESRGHKGVGATFLAYGFNFIRLESKRSGSELSAVLKQGRHWAEDPSFSVPRPRFEQEKFKCPELQGESSGTCIEIHVGELRPKLDWIQATSADQWHDLLRIKSPLGGLYLSAIKREKNIQVAIRVRDQAGSLTDGVYTNVDYFYPHELPNLHKVKTISEIEKKVNSLTGDPKQRMQKLTDDFRRLDAVYEVWRSQDILDNEIMRRNLQDDQLSLIGKYDLTIYGCFVSSAKTWTDFQKNYLKVRPTAVLLRGGLQFASDRMVQGDLHVIPLTSTIGYQNNTHIILHLVDGNPDMGRKVFQPEIKALGDELARRVVDIFKRYLSLMREDTGLPSPTSSKELWQWKRTQQDYRDANPLTLQLELGSLPLVSVPQSEQDVVSLFHELLGMGVLKGYRIFATSQHEKYDCAFATLYDETTVYEMKSLPLGVSQESATAEESEPLVLEYKYDLDGLIADLAKDAKFLKDLDLIVCWTIGQEYRDNFTIAPYLVGDEGSTRRHFGATHTLCKERERVIDIICLKDLIAFLNSPDEAKGVQRSTYLN